MPKRQMNSAGATLEPGLILSEQFARLLCAFKECSTSIQQAIFELAEVIAHPETDDDERAAAIATIAEALFPMGHDGRYGIDLAASEQIDRTVEDGGGRP